MKARYVNESVNFERGMDPKSSMGIGMFDPNLDWSGEPFNKKRSKIVDKFIYKGEPIIIIEILGFREGNNKYYDWSSPKRVFGGKAWQSKEDATKVAKKRIDEDDML